MAKNNIIIDNEHRYWNGAMRVPGVSEIIQSAGCSYIPDKSGDALLSAIEDGLEDAEKYGIPGVSRGHIVEYIDKARRFGTAVHKAVYLFNSDNLKKETLDVNLLPYLNSWRQFVRDYGFIGEAGEELVYSEQWNFAGTLDCRGKIRKTRKVIIDVKTTHKIQASSAIQLELYDIASGGGHIKLVVLLGPDGYEVKEYSDAGTKSVAISAIQIFNWKKKNNLLKGW